MIQTVRIQVLVGYVARRTAINPSTLPALHVLVLAEAAKPGIGP